MTDDGDTHCYAPRERTISIVADGVREAADRASAAFLDRPGQQPLDIVSRIVRRAPLGAIVVAFGRSVYL